MPLINPARRERTQKVKGLYVILDYQFARGRSELELARAAIRGGARIIQWRDKVRDKGEQLPIAKEVRKLCQLAGVLFIINDHVDLAIAADADGVHVGQKDLPIEEVRKLLPPDRIAGVSTALLPEALNAEASGADYIAVGSIFPTASKEKTRPAGLETLRNIKASVSVPVIAIGGINENNIAEVVKAGADAVAVISAVLSTEDVEGQTRRLVSKMMEEPHA